MCGYYDPSHAIFAGCAKKDFLLTLFFTASLPTIGLFGLQATRLSIAFCSIVFLVVYVLSGLS
jgi:hypothetical protein